MKFPKPRLRQVFEHSTHFKVVSPGGKNITIAKKALSPQLTTRLRRFAQGGEVGHYADGIETPNQAEAEAIANVAASNAAIAQQPVTQQPLEEVAPQTLEMTRPAPTRRRPVGAEEATGVAMTVEEQAAQKLAELRAQEEADKRKAAQPAPAAPAPVVVNVNTAPAPAAAPAPVAAKAEAPVEKPTEAAPAAPAPTAPAAPRRGSQIVTERLAPPPVDVTPAPAVTIPSGDFVGPPEAPAPAPMGQFLTRPGLLTPLAAPAPTPATAPVAAPVAAPVVTPAIAPAPAVGPLPATPMLPPVPPVPEFKPVTVEQVRKEMVEVQKTTPTASQPQLIQSAVSKLTGGLTLPPLELQAITDLSKQEPKQIIDEAIRDRINAKQAEAQAAYQTAVEQAQFADQQYKESLARATRQQIAMEELDKRAADLRANAEANDDIKSFWGGQGFWRSVLGIAALAVSGYTAGYAGTENIAYKAFENALARDIDEQKRKRTMRWKQYEDILGDKDDAAKLYGADLKEIAAADLERMAKTGAVRMVGPRYNELIAQIRESAAKDRLSLALKEGALEARETEAEAKKTAAARPRIVAGPKIPSTFAREKWETGRTFSLDGIPVKSPGSEGMAAMRDNLGARNYAVGALESAVKDVSSLKPGESINVLSQDRQKALASLALQIENFPQAFGYKRAVSLVAKKQLEKALADPTGIPAALKQFFGDVDIATGIKELRDEAVAARRAFVEANTEPVQRQKDAAEYGLWRLRSKELRSVGLQPPPPPKLSTPYSELESMTGAAMTPTMSMTPTAPAAGTAPVSAPTGVDVRSFLRRK